jgi:tetratricopeptide (TPR) repeat protein
LLFRLSFRSTEVSEKLDRKQLKQPDEFQVLATKAMEWTIKHQKQVVTGIVAAAVLALVGWGVAAYRGSREEKAGGALSEALELATRPLAGEVPPGTAVETFPSKEEREKATIAALRKVKDDFGGSRAAETATAQIGFHELQSGDAAAATKDLQEFLGSAGKDHPLRFVAQQSLGYALQAQGKLDEAKAAFAQLRELGHPALADFQDARLALVQNKPDAKTALEKFGKDYPKELELTREANERVELATLPPVTAPGPTPAPPTPEPAKIQPSQKPASPAKRK